MLLNFLLPVKGAFMYRYKGTGNNGTFAWIFQRISGLVIAVMATVIFYQISYGDGIHSFSPGLLFPVIAFGLCHTFSGFKMITDDYVSNRTFRAVLLCIYWFACVALLGLGLFTIISMN